MRQKGKKITFLYLRGVPTATAKASLRGTYTEMGIIGDTE